MNAQIRQEAAEWIVELQLDVPDAATRERFTEWLRASPEHVRAYLELVAIWDDARHYDSGHEVDVETLLARARHETNLVSLDRTVPPEATLENIRRSPRGARVRRIALGVGLAAVVTMVIFAIGMGSRDRTLYTTQIGEQRMITLADGSVVELNAVSRIRVSFTAETRNVDLLQGQALFKVAKNKARPFVVRSGDVHVRALGTEFDVHRRAAGTLVTVLEGTVAVAGVAPESPSGSQPLSVPAAALEVAAGEQVDVAPRAAPRKVHANVAIATAWTQQQLIFDSTPLSEAAEEFNRFNTQKLIVQDGRIRQLLISGTFPALDPASLTHFVHFLRAQPGVVVTESAEQIVIGEK